MALWSGSLGRLTRDEGEKQMIRSPKIVILLSASFICCNGMQTTIQVHLNSGLVENWQLYIRKNESDPHIKHLPPKSKHPLENHTLVMSIVIKVFC